MAADLHIHVLTDEMTEKDLTFFFSNTMGSKWFNPVSAYESMHNSERREAEKRVSDAPGVWIGEVSWLKAALTEDAETFVPPTVNQISEIIGEDLPVIDDALIERVCNAFNVPNETGYGLAEKDKVREFLESHKGRKAFTVSW